MTIKAEACEAFGPHDLRPPDCRESHERLLGANGHPVFHAFRVLRRRMELVGPPYEAAAKQLPRRSQKRAGLPGGTISRRSILDDGFVRYQLRAGLAAEGYCYAAQP